MRPLSFFSLRAVPARTPHRLAAAATHPARILLLVCGLAAGLVAADGETGGAYTAVGDGSRERPFPVPRAATPITMDGLLDEPAWDHALQLELPYETLPSHNTPARVRTEVLVTYDEHALLVGFRAHDPEPSEIQAHLSNHDDISRDDQVGLEIDTFNDERRCYLFFVNPFGIQEDSVARDSDFDFSWDTMWSARARLQPWGYSVEIAVPFSSIRFQRAEGPQVWGFNAERLWFRDRPYWTAATPWDRDNSCRWCQMLKIEGFEGVSPGKNVELIPAVTMTRSDARTDFPHGAMERLGEETEAALTAHLGATPNLTLSGTLNPDFSQVEADALQLDINQPFALFFAEKRPFFSEGADFFTTPLDIVYTRTMRDPVWGLKLGGKEGPHTLGAYVVEDDVTNLLLPSSRSSAGTSSSRPNTSTVLRYARDLGSRHTVGILLTGREASDYFNRVAGIDALLRVGDADTISAQVLASSTRYPDQVVDDFDQPAGTFDDTAILLDYSHTARTWIWRASYEQLGEDFRADVGFVPQVGFRQAELYLQRRWWAEPGEWWSKIDVGVDAEASEDAEGFVLHRGVGPWFRYQGRLHSTLFIGAWQATEGFAGREFHFRDMEVSGGLRPVNSLNLDLLCWIGDKIDYLNARLGDRVRIRPQLTWNANQHLRVDLLSTFERMDVDGERYYDAAITQLTAAYQFNVRAFARAIVQYVDHDYTAAPEPEIEVPEDVERLFVQLLYSYQLNPRSVLFVGYSDSSMAGPGYDLTRADRTLFVKVGYSLSL